MLFLYINDVQITTILCRITVHKYYVQITTSGFKYKHYFIKFISVYDLYEHFILLINNFIRECSILILLRTIFYGNLLYYNCNVHDFTRLFTILILECVIYYENLLLDQPIN